MSIFCYTVKIVRKCFLCLFFVIPQRIGEELFNSASGIWMASLLWRQRRHFALFTTQKHQTSLRTKGLALGTRFQLRAFEARRGNLVRKTDTREGQTTTLTLCVRELIIFCFAKPLLFLGLAPYVNIAKGAWRERFVYLKFTPSGKYARPRAVDLELNRLCV